MTMAGGRGDRPRREGGLDLWQSGQRGSQRAMARAMTCLVVMKESSKWRSGRASVRTKATAPCGREGKNAMAFSHREGIATKGHGYVVVPTSEAAALVALLRCAPAAPIEVA